MKEEIQATRNIHNLVRGNLPFKESLALLDEICNNPDLMAHLEMDMMLHQMFSEEHRRLNTFVKWY